MVVTIIIEESDVDVNGDGDVKPQWHIGEPGSAWSSGIVLPSHWPKSSYAELSWF